jgi:predicted anti-sigma-YlaC factor YlaD
MNWLQGVNRLLFLRCRDAAHLLTAAMDRKLPPLDRTAVRLHLCACADCRRYRGQLTFLRQLLAAVARHRAAMPATNSLSQESRRRIGAFLASESSDK